MPLRLLLRSPLFIFPRARSSGPSSLLSIFERFTDNSQYASFHPHSLLQPRCFFSLSLSLSLLLPTPFTDFLALSLSLSFSFPLLLKEWLSSSLCRFRECETFSLSHSFSCISLIYPAILHYPYLIDSALCIHFHARDLQTRLYFLPFLSPAVFLRSVAPKRVNPLARLIVIVFIIGEIVDRWEGRGGKERRTGQSLKLFSGNFRILSSLYPAKKKSLSTPLNTPVRFFFLPLIREYPYYFLLLLF